MSEFAKMAGWQSPDAAPREVIRGAGYAAILASAAAALLPAGNFENGPVIVGSLMLFVGLLEMLGSLFRVSGRRGGTAAGLASVAAGVLVFTQPAGNFVTTVYIFISWLLARGLLLGISSIESAGPIRRVTALAAATDFILAAVVWTGLTASALVIALFGPTKPIIADFAWVVAISFLGSGLLLVRLAREQRAG